MLGLRKNISITAIIVGLIFSIGLPSIAHADTLDVTATVPAPLPTGAPVITSPTDQQRFAANTIDVEGTCSPDTAYVVINRNGVAAGSAPCVSGQFHLQISLLPGANILIARSFSSTDGEGPSSNSITVYWDIPVPPSPPTPPTSHPETLPPHSTPLPLLPPGLTPAPQGREPEGLFITYEPRYLVHKPGDIWSWNFTVHGGVPPYIFTVSWGDGKASSYVPDANNHVHVEHSYQQEGIFLPMATVTDAQGNRASLHFFTVARSDTPVQMASPPLYAWVIAGILLGCLVVFALLDIELLAASMVQLFKKSK